MPLLADRVRETSATTGTGTLTLAGAVAGYQGFNAAFANADTVYYVIQYATEWEVGIGTVGTGTLSRDSVLSSSNADALVPFSAGTKDVFVAYVAERAVTTSDAATLTNKAISGSTNTLSNIPNAATTAASANTPSAIVARDASGNFAAGTVTAALTGNASTATALATARTINGVSFDGTANITVTAAAGTLTGSTLAAGVTASSLTSVGTLNSLTMINALTANTANGSVGLNYGVSASPQRGNVWYDTDGSGWHLSIGKVQGGSFTEQVRIGDNGNVSVTSGNLGIGTASPGTRLHVLDTSTPIIVRVAGSSGQGLLQQFKNQAGSGKFNWFIGAQYAVNNGFEIAASTAVDGDTPAAPMFRLTSDGNLGLGVTPSANDQGNALFLASGREIIWSGPSGYLSANATYAVGADRYIISGFASSYVQTNGTHIWRTAASGTAGNAISFTQDMTLDASGNLGIGTASPTSGFRLDVQATIARQRIESTTGTNQAEQRFVNSGGTFYVSLDSSVGAGFGTAYAAAMWHTGNYPMLFGTNNTERARIPAAGGMVVGTAALATSATDGFLYVPTCAGTPTGTPTTHTGTAPIIVDTTNHKLYFFSGGTWRDAGP